MMNMEFFFDPNVVYLFLAAGLALTILALFNPGTGVLEVLGLLTLIVAGYGVFVLSDRGQINWWSSVVIVAGLVLFVLSVRSPERRVYLVVAIVCLVLGSAYLFRSDVWYLPGVNPYLSIAVSVVLGSFFWIAARKVLEASLVRPTHDLGALIGALGEAKSVVHKEGSVQVHGELWSAHSDKPIAEDEPIRVVGREGFLLKVEAVQEDEGA